MRRRSAGRPGGQRSGSTRERLGSSDLALWRARAHLGDHGFCSLPFTPATRRTHPQS